MEPEKNFYEILEVYPAATMEEIETNYRMLLYKYHPDHNPDRMEWAHQMTSKVVEAFDCLSHPEKRKLHNFQIYCPVKRQAMPKKFMFFQKKKQQQWESAVMRFTAGVALFPRQKGKALVKFQEAISLWPAFPEALYNIALCLVDLRKIQEARSYFARVLEVNPKDQEIKRTLRRLDELKQG
jgi:curved DNA-binding protein CbpA